MTKRVATVQLQPGASAVGHLSGIATGLVMQWQHAVPLLECRVAGDRTRRARAADNIISYS
jgi:hypothetical protein